ncbi:MAG: CYTH domain-containing protein [Balneolaceae bacterium]|nr:CYTH domain-containing protein [Balneolaceae bacterium]
MEKEIERKFIVNKDSFQELKSSAESKDIKQTYIAVTEDREVRLRSIDDESYLLTVKSSGDIARDEYEIELTDDQAEKFLPLMESNRIHKRRYLIPYDDLTIETDEYLGDLEGLIIAEVEFENKDNAHNFNPPSWFGLEVTDRDEFKNKNLVVKDYSEIKSLTDE